MCLGTIPDPPAVRLHCAVTNRDAKGREVPPPPLLHVYPYNAARASVRSRRYVPFQLVRSSRCLCTYAASAKEATPA